MDDFASVWGRVTGTQQPEHETMVLQRWIRDKMDSIHAYTGIMQAPLPPNVRDTLKRILREEQRQLKRLRTMQYLRLAADDLPEWKEEQQKKPLMQCLRERYNAEIAQGESFRRNSACRQDLAAISLRLAEEEDSHAAILRRLIESLL
jgi:rubrerythrin